MSHPFEPPLTPMEARVKTAYPGEGWTYEPKWDGFRALAWSPPEVRLDSRNHKPLLRYFPELKPALEALPAGTVVDCEIVVVVNDLLAFDTLQMRIHPAVSRITKLSEETPARLVAFDLLAHEGADLRELPWTERRAALEQVLAPLEPPWHLTPTTTDQPTAERWFTEFEAAGCDGIVAKETAGPYVEGKRKMIKLKHRRSVDVVVGGYREHKDGGKIGSLLLGLYDAEAQLHFIGHCSGFSNHDRVELLTTFEALKVDDSFGDAARRPGGASRWSSGRAMSFVPVKPGIVVQISYDQLTEGRFRHATRFERWRPDKNAEACTFDQLERPEGPGFDRVVKGN